MAGVINKGDCGARIAHAGRKGCGYGAGARSIILGCCTNANDEKAKKNDKIKFSVHSVCLLNVILIVGAAISSLKRAQKSATMPGKATIKPVLTNKQIV